MVHKPAKYYANVDEMVRLEEAYRAGEKSLAAIAAEFGRSVESIMQAANRHRWTRVRRVTAQQAREWTDAELRRAKRMLESGDFTLAEVAKRFGTSREFMRALAQRLGWSTTMATRLHNARAPKKQLGRNWSEIRAEGGLCGGRILEGHEKEYWKGVYERRDREERARREAQPAGVWA